MRTLIFSIVFILIFLSFVQTRSLESYDSDLELSEKYFIEPPDYKNLLTFLNTRKTNLHKNNNNNNNNNQKVKDSNLSKNEQLSLLNRRFFLFDIFRPKQGGRTPNAYGRKSHWDTFFG